MLMILIHIIKDVHIRFKFIKKNQIKNIHVTEPNFFKKNLNYKKIIQNLMIKRPTSVSKYEAFTKICQCVD